MYDELDRCETVLLVDGAHGQYVPKIFAEQYISSEWGISVEARQVLLAGPEHELYWEVWAEEVLGFASRTDLGGKIWFLAQTPEGDLFACHRRTEPKLSSEQYAKELGLICPVCESNDIRAGAFDSNQDSAWQPCTCECCGATWNDVYFLGGYEDLDIPNNKGT